MMDGNWKPTSVWGGIKEGMIDLAPLNEVVPCRSRRQGEKQPRKRLQQVPCIHSLARLLIRMVQRKWLPEAISATKICPRWITT
ncbi:MAG: hypothetical protein R3E89_15310 [Thiolinea sp.]